MSPLMIAVLVFIAVQALLGVLLFVLTDSTGKIADRLDMLTGRKKKEDEQTNILKKSAIERDKKSLLKMFTPNLPSLHKVITQADANIKPSTLMAIGSVLGFLGFTGSWLLGVQIYLAPL